MDVVAPLERVMYLQECLYELQLCDWHLNNRPVTKGCDRHAAMALLITLHPTIQTLLQLLKASDLNVSDLSH